MTPYPARREEHILRLVLIRAMHSVAMRMGFAMPHMIAKPDELVDDV